MPSSFFSFVPEDEDEDEDANEDAADEDAADEDEDARLVLLGGLGIGLRDVLAAVSDAGTTLGGTFSSFILVALPTARQG